MSTNDVNPSNNLPSDAHVAAAEAGTEARTPGGTAAVIDAVNGAHQGFHPIRSLWGLTGHGSRGTLRRKHVFTLCCKLFLGLAQVSTYHPNIFVISFGG